MNLNTAISGQKAFSLLQEQKNKCIYCRKTFTKLNPPTVEHVIPLSKGGTNGNKNKVFACKGCNSRRGNLDIELFLEGYICAKDGGPKKVRGPKRWYHGDIIKW